jgi:hypothetical protein
MDPFICAIGLSFVATMVLFWRKGLVGLVWSALLGVVGSLLVFGALVAWAAIQYGPSSPATHATGEGLMMAVPILLIAYGLGLVLAACAGLVLRVLRAR